MSRGDGKPNFYAGSILLITFAFLSQKFSLSSVSFPGASQRKCNYFKVNHFE